MKVSCVKYSDMKKLYPAEDCQVNLRDKALSTITPINRGTG